MNVENLASDLKMKKLFFRKCVFERNNNITQQNLKIDISKNVSKKTPHNYEVEVIVNISSEEILCEVVAVADFEFKGDVNREENIVNTNTVAIMFPFIRSQVSLMTTQPDLMPIILPPINTKKLID